MSQNKPLSVADIAPQFSVTDTAGQTIQLSDYKKGYTLVTFLRYAGCPWCNLAVHRLAMEQPLLRDSGCSVIAFIQSSDQNIKSNIFERHEVKPLFPIVSDNDMEIYRRYDVTPKKLRAIAHQIKHIPDWVHSVSKEGFVQESIDGNLFLAPAVFLISPRDQKIIRADYNADLYKHESFTDIYDAITHHKLYGYAPSSKQE